MMNLKYIRISILCLLFLAFAGCDKIEGPYIKPLETERNVLVEMVADAQTIDHELYQKFSTLTEEGLVIPVLVLSGDTNVQGNSLSANQLISNLGISTSASLALFNRKEAKPDQWQSNLDAALSQKGEFELQLDGGLNEEDMHFKGQLNVKSLNGYQKPLNYSVYVIEDEVSINGNEYNHVLRLAQHNIALEVTFKNGEMTSDSLNINLSTYVDDVSKVSLIAFLQDAETDEVLQVVKQVLSSSDTPNEEPVFYTKQKILIEDFTGSRCLNCPTAHRELTQLLGVYSEQLIGVAIHYGWFAEPLGEEYPNDFRTEIGTAIGDAFVGQATSLPQGLVNRIGEGNQRYFAPAEWDGKMSDLVAQTPKVGISLNAYISNNQIKTILHFKAFEDVSELLKVQVLITESGIVSPQIDGGETVQDYVHNHVLRGSLNGLWGDEITPAPFTKDQVIKLKFSGNIDTEWNKEHLSVVVVVYNDVTQEVVQVEEQHLH